MLHAEGQSEENFEMFWAKRKGKWEIEDKIWKDWEEEKTLKREERGDGKDESDGEEQYWERQAAKKKEKLNWTHPDSPKPKSPSPQPAVRNRYIEPRMLPIRKDLLYRLRWNIFGLSDDIQITTGPVTITVKEDTNQVINTDISQTSVVPLFSSHLADESLFDPPLTRIDKVGIAECQEKQSYYESHDVYDYKAPQPLTIDNMDSAPITLRQFVKAVHAYLNLNANAIKKIKAETYGRPNESGGKTMTCGDPYLPDDISFWFHRAHAQGREEKVRVSVDVLAEGEPWLSRGSERFWEVQLRTARWNELGHSTM